MFLSSGSAAAFCEPTLIDLLKRAEADVSFASTFFAIFTFLTVCFMFFFLLGVNFNGIVFQ